MSDLPVLPEDLRRLARLVETHQLSELRFEEDDLRITLRTTPPAAAPAPVVPLALAPASKPDSPVESAGISIEAPIMGIYYRAPAPGSSPFIEIGDLIEVGQPIGMIEAMKTFSEVLSETEGRVVALPAENGKMVQPGDPLVVVMAE